jgi:prepilin-type N-terminal cleavage/methylation domain-containing protein
LFLQTCKNHYKTFKTIMKLPTRSTKGQRGFTLIEMSVTMAAAGLLFAAVATGQELIDQAKSTKLLNDVKSVEMQIQRFASAKGRMPGDCNADGIIDYTADGANASTSLRGDINNNSRALEYSYSVLLPTIPAAGASASQETDACADNASGTGATAATVGNSTLNANVWINELKLAGIISDSVPNRTFAKLVNEDFMFVGKVTDKAGTTTGDADYNAIVVHNVPQWMARRLSTSINGQDARADRSRLRMFSNDANGNYSATWASTTSASSSTNVRDSMVSVVYFFDRVPETASGG